VAPQTAFFQKRVTFAEVFESYELYPKFTAGKVNSLLINTGSLIRSADQQNQ
jgi:hypothetical protein